MTDREGVRVGDFAVGSLPPPDYLGWQGWAGVQHRAGLRQRPCASCGLWLFPQERQGHLCQAEEP